MSHLISESKSIYFLIRFAQKKQPYLFFSTKNRDRFLGSMMFLNFLRLARVILEYLRYTRNLPYVTSIWRVASKVYLTHGCIHGCIYGCKTSKTSRILLHEIGLFLLHKLNILPLHKLLKMNSSEFSDIFDRAR